MTAPRPGSQALSERRRARLNPAQPASLGHLDAPCPPSEPQFLAVSPTEQTEPDILENHELKESDLPVQLVDCLPHGDHHSQPALTTSQPVLAAVWRLRGDRDSLPEPPLSDCPHSPSRSPRPWRAVGGRQTSGLEGSGEERGWEGPWSSVYNQRFDKRRPATLRFQHGSSASKLCWLLWQPPTEQARVEKGGQEPHIQEQRGIQDGQRLQSPLCALFGYQTPLL